MHTANAALGAQLRAQPAEKFDIEHLEADGAPHIEMDLACGVMDLKDSAAEAAAERTMQSAAVGLADAQSDSPSDSDSDGSLSSDGEGVDPDGQDASRGGAPVRPSGKKAGRQRQGSEQKRARITEL